jgi:hypothetical protein
MGRRTALVVPALIAIVAACTPVGMALTSESPSAAMIVAPPTPEATVVATVDGLTVVTVSELLAARASGNARGGPHALRGYWSGWPERHGCASTRLVAKLELFCEDEHWGITERNEAMITIEVSGLGRSTSVRAEGPRLNPYVASNDVWDRLRATPRPDWTPVPIVVVGHFDDPDASECIPSVRQECLDRFVLDRIASFDPSSVPAPTPSATPTPFPVSDPPPPPLGDGGWDGACHGDAPKSFIGWTRLGDLDIKLRGEWDPDTYVYALVTADVVPIGDPTVSDEDTWHESLDYPGHQIRWWGRRVCFAESPWTLNSRSIIGTTFIEVDDGRRIEASYPFG